MKEHSYLFPGKSGPTFTFLLG